MIVLYNEKKSGADDESSIRRIDAKENVKIFSEEFVASGESGYYEPAKSIFVLEKNVIVNNGSSIASGDKFVYNTITKKGNFVGKKDETSIAGNGGDKRVVVVIGGDLGESKESKKSKNKNEQKDPQR
jgi:lipopolysaccharide export system protein LptA